MKLTAAVYITYKKWSSLFIRDIYIYSPTGMYNLLIYSLFQKLLLTLHPCLEFVWNYPSEALICLRLSSKLSLLLGELFLNLSLLSGKGYLSYSFSLHLLEVLCNAKGLTENKNPIMPSNLFPNWIFIQWTLWPKLTTLGMYGSWSWPVNDHNWFWSH